MAEAMAPTEVDAELAAQPPLPPEQIAPHFPQLEILECLGRGGMGVVYKAQQKSLGRFVALKLLAPERVGDPKFAERFAYEAQALAALNHPNIVTIYDFGQAGGFYYLLMEFVDGMNLRQLLGARKFTPEEALAVVPPLCDALQFAHDRGFVHRDIKPENLLLDKAGRVKVADFGIAKMLGTVQPTGDAGPTPAPENATQAAIGTPGYSAPEQKTHPNHVDSRADIYSLGVVIYEMLTGELPGKRIEPPSSRMGGIHIDVRLDEVVLRALEMKPELRYQQVSEVKTLVETIVQSPDPLPPPTPAAGSSTSTPGKEASKTMKSKTAVISIIASACLVLAAGIAAVLFFTGDETIHIRGIPRDWSCLSGDISQWNSGGNAIYGHTSNGDSILASAKQYGDVTFSAMISTTNREASLALRMQDPDDGYLVIFGPDGTSTASWNGGHIWLIKRKSGQEKQLATFNRGGLSAPGQLEKLTLIAKGPRLEVRLNDVTIMTTSDRTFAAGYIGLRIYGDPKYPCDGVFSNLTVRARR
jgi:serine/threonine protein kinase